MWAAEGIGAVATAIVVRAAEQAPHRRPDPASVFMEIDRQLSDSHLTIADIDRIKVLAKVAELLLGVCWRVGCGSNDARLALRSAAGAEVRFDGNSGTHLHPEAAVLVVGREVEQPLHLAVELVDPRIAGI